MTSNILEPVKKSASTGDRPARQDYQKPIYAKPYKAKPAVAEPLNKGKVDATRLPLPARPAPVARVSEPVPEGTLTFADMPISLDLKRSLALMGFTIPSPIQAKAIPVMLSGQDMIGQAQTGTGKTAAFAIPTIHKLNPQVRYPQVLVVCPTRELAVQVSEQFKKLLKSQPDVGVVAVYGGEPIQKQFKLLRKNPQIIVGTPGRLLDHMKRETLDLSTVGTVILDEADEMLNMGFREPIESILQAIPQPRQLVFFSATLPSAIRQLMNTYLKQPVLVEIPVEHKVSALIEQFYLEVQSRQKMDALVKLFQTYQINLSLVFCNTKRQVDATTKHLQGLGYHVEALHGGMPQAKRDKVMAKFRRGAITCLVATDVAARGIDVNNIEAVINYDFPNDNMAYTHRIGRTGRAGNTGRSFTFVEPRQSGQLRMLRRQPELIITRLDA